MQFQPSPAGVISPSTPAASPSPGRMRAIPKAHALKSHYGRLHPRRVPRPCGEGPRNTLRRAGQWRSANKPCRRTVLRAGQPFFRFRPAPAFRGVVHRDGDRLLLNHRHRNRHRPAFRALSLALPCGTDRQRRDVSTLLPVVLRRSRCRRARRRARLLSRRRRASLEDARCPCETVRGFPGRSLRDGHPSRQSCARNIRWRVRFRRALRRPSPCA